jgi:PadR family transcriptional regulator, regulatory protein PadR
MAVRRSLTDLEFMILLAVLRLTEQAYGVTIGREIEQLAKRTVTRASLYVALDRLEQRGLVRSTVGDSTPERGGRAKRYFTVTGTGLRAVRDTQRAFVALWAGIRPLAGTIT